MNNTVCVAAQLPLNTNRSVRELRDLLHNWCMEKPAIDLIAVECGKRIRACREAKGWTQAEMSAATGYASHRPRGTALGATQIANYEQGKRRPAAEDAEILARLFPEYPAPYFMGLITEREASMLALLRRAG